MTRNEVVLWITRLTEKYVAEHGAPNRFFGREYAGDLGISPLQVGAALREIAEFNMRLPFGGYVTHSEDGRLCVAVDFNDT